MARKRTEIALQVEIETQEEWEEMLAKEGLTVVDIYQEWCGPCKGMTSNFRRMKNELGDDLLRFAAAKADSVDALDKYKGRCEPCFLFFAGGILVSVIRGANSPLLMRTITEQLSYEHRVLDGGVERKEIKDPLLADLEDQEKVTEDDEEDDENAQKGVTVAIIKPNVVEEGKVDEIMEQMREAGIEILESTERQLTEDEAREFYAHCSEQEYFEDLVKFMSSGPSQVLVLTKGETGEGIVEEWRELLGPTSVEEAKEKAPDSLRAKYGKESYVNAVHGSDSHERAMAELAFFFPGFVAPSLRTKSKKTKVQRTLALIRPDALREKKDEILAKIAEAGFQVAMQKEMQLSKEQVAEFYSEHRDQPYFDELTTRMSSGPLLALALAREDAVHGWRELLGPKEVDKAKSEAPHSLRAQFSVEDVEVNQLHGSDSDTMAEEEIKYFFPMQQTVAVIKPDALQTKDEIMQRVREAGFHIAARKETELTKDVAAQFYQDIQGKDYYDDLTEHMTSGPTLFMVLSREDAVEGWRSLIGPTDPQQAKQEAPDSLRAAFGSDIKANAVHGSSNEDHAKNSMKLIFGDIEFNADEESQDVTPSSGDDKQDASDTQETQQQQTEEEPQDVTPSSGEDKQDASDTQETDEQEQSAPQEDEAQHDSKSEHGDGKSEHGDGKSEHGDGKSEHGDDKSEHGDGKSVHADDKSEHGDDKSLHGDKSEHGDDKSQHDDATSQHGDVKSQNGDNKSQSGDDKSQHGDVKSQNGDDKEDQEADNKGTTPQPEEEPSEPETSADKEADGPSEADGKTSPAAAPSDVADTEEQAQTNDNPPQTPADTNDATEDDTNKPEDDTNKPEDDTNKPEDDTNKPEETEEVNQTSTDESNEGDKTKTKADTDQKPETPTPAD